jgi:hypothetical protein
LPAGWDGTEPRLARDGLSLLFDDVSPTRTTLERVTRGYALHVSTIIAGQFGAPAAVTWLNAGRSRASSRRRSRRRDGHAPSGPEEPIVLDPVPQKWSKFFARRV